MDTSVKFYSLGYRELKTYLYAALFIVGNIAFPQLCHLYPHGGLIVLPIYFFTLIGEYKYGMKVGLLTALLSPVINSLLFGMPLPAALPSLLLKSVLLALAAGYIARRTQRITIPLLLAVILFYQLVGTLCEWAFIGEFYAAVQDFRMGLPGMFLQIFGGYAVIKYLIRK